jgi:hypothetical protein
MTQHTAHLRRPREVAAARQFQADWAKYLRIRDEVIASILEGQTAAAIATDLELGTPTFDRARADLLAMQDRYKADAEVRRQDAEEAADQSFELVIVVLLLSQLIVIFGLGAVQALLHHVLLHHMKLHLQPAPWVRVQNRDVLLRHLHHGHFIRCATEEPKDAVKEAHRSHASPS